MGLRVAIIGGGVIGLSAAYYAARQGHAVTLIERQPAQRNGCSYGNAGMIVPSHFLPLAAPGMVALGLKWMWKPQSPFYVKPRWSRELFSWGIKFWQAANAGHVRRAAPILRDLSLASRACFEELAALPGADFGLVKKGLLMLCKTRHAFDEEARTAGRARELGIPAEVLDARQAAALDPGVTMDILGAIYFPKDCHLDPARFMNWLQSQLAGLGVCFQWNTAITGWRTQAGRIQAVSTTQGDFRADEFVLCGGSWSPSAARQLNLSLPMQAGKGYSLTLARPRQLPSLCAICTEARVAVTPMSGNLRVGGTMEIAGLDEAINPARVQGIVKAVSRYYPAFEPADFAGVTPWCGLRPCSPDGLPYLGRTARHPNLIVAAGHAMMGLSLGPITGKLVAELLSGRPLSPSLAALSPDRYS